MKAKDLYKAAHGAKFTPLWTSGLRDLGSVPATVERKHGVLQAFSPPTLA